MLREFRDYGTTTTKHPECSLRRLGSERFADALDEAKWAAFEGTESSLAGELLNPLAATAPRTKLSDNGREFLRCTAKLLDVDCMDLWTAACCIVGLPERLADNSSSKFSMADALRIRDEYYSQRSSVLSLLSEVFLACWQDSPASGPCSVVVDNLLGNPQSLLLKLKASNSAAVPAFEAGPLLQCVGFSPHTASGVCGELRTAWALQAAREQSLMLRGMHIMAYTHNYMDSEQWLELAAVLDEHSEFKPPLHLVELLQGLPAAAAAAAMAERQHHALLALLTPLTAGFVNGNTSTIRYAFQDEGLPRVQQYMRERIIPVVDSAPPSSAVRAPTQYQGAAAVIYIAWLTLNMLEHSHGGLSGPRPGADALAGATREQVEQVVHGEAAHLALTHLHRVMQDLEDSLNAHSTVIRHWCRSVQGTFWGMCACSGRSHLQSLFSSSGLRLRSSAMIPHSCHDAEMWALPPALKELSRGSLENNPTATRLQLSTDSSMQSVCVVMHDLMVGLVSALGRLGCLQPPLGSGWWVAAAEGALRGAPDRASAVMSASSAVPGAQSAHMSMLSHACSQFPMHCLPTLRLLCASAGASPVDVHDYLRHQLDTFTAVVLQSSADLAFPNGIQEGCTVVLRQPLLCEASGVLLPAGIAGTLVAQGARVGTTQELLSTCCPLQQNHTSNHSLPFTVKWHWRQPALPVLLHRLGWLAWFVSSSPAEVGVEVVAEMVATSDLLHSLLTSDLSRRERLVQLKQIASDVVRARRHARVAAADATGKPLYDSVKAATLQSDAYNVHAGAPIPELAVSDVVQWLMHCFATCLAAFSRSARDEGGAAAAWGSRAQSHEESSMAPTAFMRTSSSLGGVSSVQQSVARSAAAAAGATAVHMESAVADEHFGAWSCKLLQKASEVLIVLGELAPAELADVLSEPLGASSPRWTVVGAHGQLGEVAASRTLLGTDRPLGVQLVQAALGSLEASALPLGNSGLTLALSGLLATAVHAIAHHSVRLTAERAFSLFDLDGDGNITLAEFADTLSAVGVAADSQVVLELVRQLDINGDGKVQYNEFVRLVAHELAIADALDAGSFSGDPSSLPAQVALFVRQLVRRQPARRDLLGDLAFSAVETLILVVQRVQDWKVPLERWVVAGSVGSLLHLVCSCSLDIFAPQAATSTMKRSGIHTSEVVSLDRSLSLSASLVEALLGSPAARGAILASCSELALSGLQNCTTGTDDLRGVWNHSIVQDLQTANDLDALHSYTSTMLAVLSAALSKCSSLEVVARTFAAPVQNGTSVESSTSISASFLDCLAAYCAYHLTDPAVEPHASQLISRAVQNIDSEDAQRELQNQLGFIAIRTVTATDLSVQAAGFFPLVALAAASEDGQAAGTAAPPLPKRKRQRFLAAAEFDALTDSFFTLKDSSLTPAYPAAAVGQVQTVPQWYKGSHLLAPQLPAQSIHQSLPMIKPAPLSVGRLLEKLAPQVASAVFGHACSEEPSPATGPLRTTDAPRVLRTAGLNLVAFALHHDLPMASALLAPGPASTLRGIQRPSGLVEAAVTISAAERLMEKQPALLGAAIAVVSGLALKAATRPWATNALQLLGGQVDFWAGLQHAANYSCSAMEWPAGLSISGMTALQLSTKAASILLSAQLAACFSLAEEASHATAAKKLLQYIAQDGKNLDLVEASLSMHVAESLQAAQAAAQDAGVNLAPFRAELAAAAQATSELLHVESAVSTVDSIHSVSPWASRYGQAFMFQLPLLRNVLLGAACSSVYGPDYQESLDQHIHEELVRLTAHAGELCSISDAAAALSRGVHACCLLARNESGPKPSIDFLQQCCDVIGHSPCHLQLELAPVMHLSRCVLALVAASDPNAFTVSKRQYVLRACATAAQKLMRMRPASWKDHFPHTDVHSFGSVSHAAMAGTAIGELANSPHMQASAAMSALCETCCVILREGTPCPSDVLQLVLQVQLDIISGSQLQRGRPSPMVWVNGEWVLIPECDTSTDIVLQAASEEFAAASSTLAVLLPRAPHDAGLLQQLVQQRTVTRLIQCFLAACDAVSTLHEWHAMWWRKQLMSNPQLEAAGAAVGVSDKGTTKLPAKPSGMFLRMRAQLLDNAHAALNALLAISALPGGGACLLASGALGSLSSASLFQGMESVLQARMQEPQSAIDKTRYESVEQHAAGDAEWWGVGFGLGPSRGRGLDHDSLPCSAHSLWLRTVSIFTACISSFTKDKHDEGMCLSSADAPEAQVAAQLPSGPVLSRRLSAALSSTSIEAPQDEQHSSTLLAWHSLVKRSSAAAKAIASSPSLLDALAALPALRRSMTADRIGAWVNGSSSYEQVMSTHLPPSASCVLDGLCQEAIAFVDKHKFSVVSCFLGQQRPGSASHEISAHSSLLGTLLHPDCVPTWLRLCNNQAAACHGGRNGAPFPAWEVLLRQAGIKVDASVLLGGCVYPIAVLSAAVEDCARRVITRWASRAAWLPRERYICAPSGVTGASRIIQAGDSTLVAAQTLSSTPDGRRLPLQRQVLLGCSEGMTQLASRHSGVAISVKLPGSRTEIDEQGLSDQDSAFSMAVLQDLLGVCVACTKHAQSPLSQLLSTPSNEAAHGDETPFQNRLWEEFRRKWRPWAVQTVLSAQDTASQVSVAAAVHVAAQHATLQLRHTPRGSLFGFNSRCLFGALSGAADVMSMKDNRPGMGHLLLVITHCMQSYSEASTEANILQQIAGQALSLLVSSVDAARDGLKTDSLVAMQRALACIVGDAGMAADALGHLIQTGAVKGAAGSTSESFLRLEQQQLPEASAACLLNFNAVHSGQSKALAQEEAELALVWRDATLSLCTVIGDSKFVLSTVRYMHELLAWRTTVDTHDIESAVQRAL